MSEVFDWLDLNASSDDLARVMKEPPVQVTYAEFLDLARLIESEAQRRSDGPLRGTALRHIASTARELDMPEESEEALIAFLALPNIDFRGRGIALRDLGRLRLETDFDQGVELLREAASVFDDSGDGEFLVHVSLELGEVFGGSGNREGALDDFLRARNVARSIGRADLAARAEDRLAAGEWELGRSANAERHLRTALDIARAIGDENGLGYAQFRLGWKLADDLQHSDSRRDEALELLSAARSIAQGGADLNIVAQCDEKAAWVMGDRKDYRKAIRLITAAISVFESIGRTSGALIARVNLAGYLKDSGDLDGCIRTLRRVVRDAHEYEDQYLVAASSTRLAKHLLRIDEVHEACELLDQCEDFYSDNDNAVEGAKFLLARASAYNRLGLLEATRETAQKVLDSLERAALPSYHAEALEYLADCALADGDRLRAESLFGQAVALYLVDDELDEAMRVAERILPAPGEKVTDLVVPNLQTGQYL